MLWDHVAADEGQTYVIVREHSDHVRGHKSTERGQRVGHSEDGSGEVWRDIETVAKVSGGDGTVEEQGQREDAHSPRAVLTHVHLHDHQEAGRHHGERGEDLAGSGGGQSAGFAQMISKVRREDSHGVLSKVGQRGQQTVLKGEIVG